MPMKRRSRTSSPLDTDEFEQLSLFGLSTYFEDAAVPTAALSCRGKSEELPLPIEKVKAPDVDTSYRNASKQQDLPVEDDAVLSTESHRPDESEKQANQDGNGKTPHVAVSCWDGSIKQILPVEKWMTDLVGNCRYALGTGDAVFIALRPVNGAPADIPAGHEYYHYMVGKYLFSGTYIKEWPA